MSNIKSFKFDKTTTAGMQEIAKLTLTQQEWAALALHAQASLLGDEMAVRAMTVLVMRSVADRGFPVPEDKPENTIAITVDKTTDEFVIYLSTKPTL